MNPSTSPLAPENRQKPPLFVPGQLTDTPDSTGKLITAGCIVKVVGVYPSASEAGLVMATSVKGMEGGSVAVFFDNEVSDVEVFGFEIPADLPPPTPDNYLGHPRVLYFEGNELEVVSDFTVPALIRRFFGEGFGNIMAPAVPFLPNTLACQFATCTSKQPATKITLFKQAEVVRVVYGCDSCHKTFQGRVVDKEVVLRF